MTLIILFLNSSFGGSLCGHGPASCQCNKIALKHWTNIDLSGTEKLLPSLRLRLTKSFSPDWQRVGKLKFKESPVSSAMGAKSH